MFESTVPAGTSGSTWTVSVNAPLPPAAIGPTVHVYCCGSDTDWTHVSLSAT